MELTRDEKELVAKNLVELVLAAIKKQELTTEDMPLIADAFLGRVDYLKTREELIVLLQSMAEKWPSISQLVQIQQGKITEQQEVVAAQNVQELVKQGNIQEALTAAKAATQA